MEEKNQIKEYSNGEITVVWQAHLCKHAGACVRTNSKVFKPKEKPWVQMENSNSEDIIKAVNHCPSDALTYYENKPE